MNRDKYGNIIYSDQQILEKMYSDPGFDVSTLYLTTDKIKEFNEGEYDFDLPNTSFNQLFNHLNPNQIPLKGKLFLPEEYRNIDIENYILSLREFTSDEKLRIEAELKEFETRNMTELLLYLKYLVDTMRHNNVVWGVGRGSSVASYVLFLLGVHKIDPIKFDIPMEEFFK